MKVLYHRLEISSNFQYKSCSRYITRVTFWEIHNSTKNNFASSVKVVKLSSRSSATRSSMTQIQMLNELWSTELVICRWLLCSQSWSRDRFRKLTLYQMWCFVEWLCILSETRWYKRFITWLVKEQKRVVRRRMDSIRQVILMNYPTKMKCITPLRFYLS